MLKCPKMDNNIAYNIATLSRFNNLFFIKILKFWNHSLRITALQLFIVLAPGIKFICTRFLQKTGVSHLIKTFWSYIIKRDSFFYESRNYDCTVSYILFLKRSHFRSVHFYAVYVHRPRESNPQDLVEKEVNKHRHIA